MNKVKNKIETVFKMTISVEISTRYVDLSSFRKLIIIFHIKEKARYFLK